MALPENIRNQVAESFRKARAGQFEFMDKIRPEEDKLLVLLGKPGHLDQKVLDDQIRELNRLRGESMIKKSGHIIAIRDLLGPEKTVFLFSEMLKRFRKGFGKRMPKGRRQG